MLFYVVDNFQLARLELRILQEGSDQPNERLQSRARKFSKDRRLLNIVSEILLGDMKLSTHRSWFVVMVVMERDCRAIHPEREGSCCVGVLQMVNGKKARHLEVQMNADITRLALRHPYDDGSSLAIYCWAASSYSTSTVPVQVLLKFSKEDRRQMRPRDEAQVAKRHTVTRAPGEKHETELANQNIFERFDSESSPALHRLFHH